jgi:hypothetical protein
MGDDSMDYEIELVSDCPHMEAKLFKSVPIGTAAGELEMDFLYVLTLEQKPSEGFFGLCANYIGLGI